MAVKYIELEQLSENDFIGVISNGKLTIQLKPKDVSDHVISWLTNVPNRSAVTFVDTKEDRRKLQIKDGFGILHLDFTARTASNTNGAWTLPTTSPTPVSLIEMQTYDKGTIWIEPNTRIIKWSGLTAGQRYVVDLIGFWE